MTILIYRSGRHQKVEEIPEVKWLTEWQRQNSNPGFQAQCTVGSQTAHREQGETKETGRPLQMGKGKV